MRIILNKNTLLIRRRQILKWRLNKLRKHLKLIDRLLGINLVSVSCLDQQGDIHMDKSNSNSNNSNKFITINQRPKSNTKAVHHQLMSLLLKITNLEGAAALNYLRSRIKYLVQGNSHLSQLVTIHMKLKKSLNRMTINMIGPKITQFL